MPTSYAQIWLQKIIANATFPSNREDWYIKNGFGNSDMTLDERFNAFEAAVRQPDSSYYEQLTHLSFERFEVAITLANKKSCSVEMIAFHPTSNSTEQQNKHILYFTGMGSRYQDCIKDIAEAVKMTQASYYAFEYPGMSLLGGEVLEVNDMVNTGIALTNVLLKGNISIDDILFQGDSFGSAIAYKVNEQFKKQSNVQIRCILNNAFSTFQAAVEHTTGLPAPLYYPIAPLLRYTGWDIRPADNYGHDTPYQIHINHIGDLTLGETTLANYVETNLKSEHFIDPCPVEFLAQRDSYSGMHWAHLSEEGTNYLATKYGRNDKGLLDTHMADLYLLKFDNGLSVYKAFICQYLKDSNEYILNHPQTLSLDALPHPLESETLSFGATLYSSLPSRAALWTFFGCGPRSTEYTPTIESDEVYNIPQKPI